MLYQDFFHFLIPSFFLVSYFDPQFANSTFSDFSAGTARPRWIGWHFDASLFPANCKPTRKGARVLPFQRQTECRLRCLPSQKGRLFVTAATFFSANSICVASPHSLHVARQPLSTGAVGELYYFGFEGGKLGAFCACFSCQYLS